MKTIWHLWLDTKRTPQMNMAVDDLLLHSQEREPLTILRFYEWDRPVHSIGYFQPMASAAADNRLVIRRPSGGGVVDHGNDFTFTLTFPKNDKLFLCDRFESYRLINDAVRLALESLGVGCFLFDDDVPKDLDRAFLVCFQQPAKHDVVNERGKLCGGAQRRKRFGMLHQGSILLDQLPGIDVDKIKRSLLSAFASTLSIEFASFSPTKEFMKNARSLAMTRYSSDTWNEKK